MTHARPQVPVTNPVGLLCARCGNPWATLFPPGYLHACADWSFVFYTRVGSAIADDLRKWLNAGLNATDSRCNGVSRWRLKSSTSGGLRAGVADRPVPDEPVPVDASIVFRCGSCKATAMFDRARLLGVARDADWSDGPSGDSGERRALYLSDDGSIRRSPKRKPNKCDQMVPRLGSPAARGRRLTDR